MRSPRRWLIVAVCTGCSSATSSTSPTTGALTVTVNEPAALVGAVTVSGPGGFHQTLTSTKQLTGLQPGSYTIAATSVNSSDSVVGTMYAASVTGSPATVAVGASATAAATYTARTGTGGLWVVGGSPVGSNTANTAIEYSAAQLRASSSVPPTVQLNFPVDIGTAVDASQAAFDSHGNLWVVNFVSSTVVEYTVSQLGASGTPTPEVTIQEPQFSSPLALAFDAQGNLWVTNSYVNTIVEFTTSQLVASGSPTPAVTITDVAPKQGPFGLAFDGHGNLWVANNTSNTIVEYTPNQLTTSGTPTPAVTLSGSAIVNPNGIAFDKSGNLWIAMSALVARYTPAGRIIEIPVTSLGATGSPVPVLTILPPSGQAPPLPEELAFDDSGNLWFTDLFNSWIGEYRAQDLVAGSSPAPAIRITSATGVAPAGLAFDPHTPSVPLH